REERGVRQPRLIDPTQREGAPTRPTLGAPSLVCIPDYTGLSRPDATSREPVDTAIGTGSVALPVAGCHPFFEVGALDAPPAAAGGAAAFQIVRVQGSEHGL